MLYRKDKNGNEISQLGYGCMRFTRKGSGIDYEKAASEIMLAVDKGINYFDTAYIYPGSEECLGRILDENNCREKVYINSTAAKSRFLINSRYGFSAWHRR